ncbi:hypothetical protein GCM10009529_19670 [Micropruina glycogenica]
MPGSHVQVLAEHRSQLTGVEGLGGEIPAIAGMTSEVEAPSTPAVPPGSSGVRGMTSEADASSHRLSHPGDPGVRRNAE